MNYEQLSSLPAPVRKNGLFCCWRYEDRDGRKTKVPYNPATGQRTQSNNPDTFTSFTVATMAAVDYSGIGVGIFGELGAIDLDQCLTDSGVEPWAQDIVTTMGSYTEVSPSGEGLRILFPVTQPFQYDTARYYVNRRLNKAAGTGIEVYVSGATKKYVTVTGDVFPAPFDTQWKPRNAELMQVLERYMVREQSKQAPQQPQMTSTLNDMELLDKARNAKNGADFSRLWAGDLTGYNSHSEADMALLSHLAFWTGKDPEQMDRLFRQSGLMREKWDRRQSGSSYGALEIQKAVVRCQNVYTPEAPDRGQALDWDAPIGGGASTSAPGADRSGRESLPVSSEAQRPLLVRASDVPYEPPRWLIRPYLQKGKGTLIQADNGTGKTAFVCAIAAHVSTGKPLLDIPIATPGNVLVLSVEDDLPVLRGRIEASGGDLDKCHFMTNAAGLSFNSPEVEAAVKQVQAKLVIFDPLQAFMGEKVDMFRANETRPQLAKLFEMCDRNDCACIIIAHTGKAAGDKSPVNRALGSVDIPAAMRSVLQIIKSPDDELERIAVHVKCSNARKGQSIRYTIGDRGGVQWVGFSPMTDEDLSTIERRREREKVGISYENEPLVQVLLQLITDRPAGGFWSYAQVKEEGQKVLGFPPYYDLKDLREKIDAIAKELQQRDHLIVTHSQTGKANKRGIKIERYEVPQGFQTKMEG